MKRSWTRGRRWTGLVRGRLAWRGWTKNSCNLRLRFRQRRRRMKAHQPEINMTTLNISYTTGVHTPAGWRQVTIKAEAEKISAGMAVVAKVIEIDGEAPHYGMSRTGANRQRYNGSAIALREVGAKKRLSACTLN